MGLFDILSEFAASAFQPGVNRGLIYVLHTSFIALIAVLLFLNVLLEFKNPHVWALLAITSALYYAIIWYTLLKGEFNTNLSV